MEEEANAARRRVVRSFTLFRTREKNKSKSRCHRDTFLDRRVNCALRANAEHFLSAAAMLHTIYAAGGFAQPGTLQCAVERRYSNAVIRRTI